MFIILLNIVFGCLVILRLLAMASLISGIYSQLADMEQRIRMKLSELSATLTTLGDQVEKVRVVVQALKDSLADVDLPAEAQAALDRLTASVAAVDQINPDA